MSTLLEELQGTEAMPDITVSLPTLGRWYLEYDPTSQVVQEHTILREGTDVEEVDIKVIGVLAELNYKDPYLLVSGQSLPKLVKHVCPSVIKPDMLTEVDIEAILLASRIASYGNEMKLDHECANKVKGKVCGETNIINLDLQQFIMRYAPFELEYFERYTLSLERLGHTLFLRPPPYKEVINFQKRAIVNENKATEFNGLPMETLLLEVDKVEDYAKIMESNTEMAADSIASCILYVVGRDEKQHWDRDELNEYIRGIPADEIDMLRERIREIGTKLGELSKLEYTCTKCKKKNTLSLHMDPQRLFTRGEVSNQPKKPSPQSPGTGRKGKTQSKVMRR